MKNKSFDFKFLNIVMYIGAVIILFYVLKNLGIMSKISAALVALTPVYTGIIICWVSMPLAKKMKQLGLKDKSAAIVSLIIIFGIFVVLLAVMIPLIVSEVANLVTDLPSIYESVVNNINSFLYTIYNKLHIDSSQMQVLDLSNNLSKLSFVTKYFDDILGYSINTVQKAFSIIISIFTTVVVSFFMVKDMDKFKQNFMDFLSKNNKEGKRYKMLLEIDEIIMSYIKGILLDSFVVGVLTTIVCYILGIKYAIIFGILIMFLNLIPYIGALISEIIISLFALSTGGITFAIITFILLVLIQVIDANILQPNIVAKSINLHPVTVLSGLIIFNLLFGLFGMIIALPVMAIIKIIFKYTLNNDPNFKRFKIHSTPESE